MQTEFTYKYYKKIINLLNENGYVFSSYKDYGNYEKAVILRHDIDASIDKALEMAQLENEIGISSTYFVMLTSDHYNIFSKKNEYSLRHIINLGHKVGLHYDEAKYGPGTDFVENVNRECEILGYCIENFVDAVSMHRPSKKTLEMNYVFGGISNTYSEEFFSKFKYVSDSRMHWRENIFEIIKSGKYPQIQLLTHPFWYYEQNRSMKEILLEFINSACMERYNVQDENMVDLGNVIKVDEILK